MASQRSLNKSIGQSKVLNPRGRSNHHYQDQKGRARTDKKVNPDDRQGVKTRDSYKISDKALDI